VKERRRRLVRAHGAMRRLNSAQNPARQVDVVDSQQGLLNDGPPVFGSSHPTSLVSMASCDRDLSLLPQKSSRSVFVIVEKMNLDMLASVNGRRRL
jgi:hypothetical protein